ncbi:MAG: tRNA 2-thiouridine(34) synthase MnmA [Lachnospiraceae bacterium]|nr:tRNA 2-thiouridine(34) synthase MnmA [Lachnospiraceae bacterium]
MKKALIAMSGGVDSSVAAYLMVEQGYECMGATMKLYTNSDIDVPKGHTCCSLDDVEDARFVAQTLNIPYYVLNFKERFKEDVMDKFVNSYENGITPNPCIDCNRYLKFEYLFNRAKELGLDYVVTGHYALIEFNEKTGRYILKKSPFPEKDQSYVLYSLTQEQLAHTLFPLARMSKTEVRALAEEKGFINARKHDSQDICFVPDGDYVSFIEKYTKKLYPHGNFIDKIGNVLGEHKGIIRYTIGQRKGLGLSLKEPMYVMNINPIDNTVMLGTNDDLFTTELIADDVNWISIENLTEPMHVNAKVRYRHTEAPATVTPYEDGKIKVTFDEPQRAITKGQAVVLYDNDTVVGGGTIIEV